MAAAAETFVSSGCRGLTGTAVTRSEREIGDQIGAAQDQQGKSRKPGNFPERKHQAESSHIPSVRVHRSMLARLPVT
jgi:hypothetical protein